MDQNKAKDLVNVCRPQPDEFLTAVDFVKSTESVYKEFHLRRFKTVFR
jgi:hypothetical protein